MCCDEKERALKEYVKNNLECDEILKKLKEVHSNNPYMVENNIGNNSKVCFVFSCPGRHELINNKILCGSTGENLNTLLEFLNKYLPKLFPWTERYKYDLLNATSVVHFRGLDDKTEGSKEEIFENKATFEEYVKSNKNLKYAILCGQKSKELKKIFGEKCIYSKHLSLMSLNHIDKDIDGKEISAEDINDSKERTKKRIETIAKNIVNQINAKE